ncbi:MAG: response regulator [Pseudomonadota bacterium]
MDKLLFTKCLIEGVQMFNIAETKKSDDSHIIHTRPQGLHDLCVHRKAGNVDIVKPKRILVVDDDNALCNLLAIMLSELKFEVKSVNNAYDALDLFINEEFELVLTDIQMPGMNGWELACNIKKTSPETPVILMTGMIKDAVIEGMKNGHADSVLFKPFALKDLEETLYGFLADQGCNEDHCSPLDH